uniref:Ancillary SecYEG translocon subunit/Cell division coordinator CpoB TPR domain-containing protein n=1 Tax=Eucampia antarctica TaxID=49252 RepID=A0A7S2SF23_9STRA|mmetsp:Transcript_7354/g.6948  ORF Transcript_7354/g.6948 Transcript_7354/m.6948 type:complete len:661 (+) Transcript_7354:135-2117(+)|eukprot:CAMPEP_0197831888 /NCGR_PEP_ID=MMETSP1437-20131217/12578_1 /TAXON_ID=49252 ORGANISM="Eucampia antarctica, Strain CCMP1452" /NCGR_SAMPLE_ID=MMETSP1437 /ASSEMBLY_ACC=CAM_ASM_001096 /LENGTH=660 /DNA_ID=CAMNT_0043435007 /DNA_START=84 /DNA_END=2066 /DNA_ORIENTATION=+
MADIRSLQSSKYLNLGFLALACAGLWIWHSFFRPGLPDAGSTKLLKDLAHPSDDDEEDDEVTTKTSNQKNITIGTSSKSVDFDKEVKTPLASNSASKSETTNDDGKSDLASMHKRIEDIDKRGKVHFKAKKYMEAAEAFTEALNLIEDFRNNDSLSSDSNPSLSKQVATLANNRAAMYEKANLPDLALADCEGVLEIDPSHAKARTRKLRILESLERYNDSLTEVCAMQLKFMQDNREQLRLGIPVTPPVPQSKIEELMAKILPQEIENELKKIDERIKNSNEKKPLPSAHTIAQLLQSFTSYNVWMASAAREGNLDSLTAKLNELKEEEKAQKVELLLKRGRRFAFHRKFESMSEDFEAAHKLLEEDENVKDLLEGDSYARILEWVGMCRHLRYDMSGALKCYELCGDLEPTNAEIIVKRAGVKMDGGKLDEALSLFDTALGLDPDAVDALLHRANLNLLRVKHLEAKADLERFLELRPDNILARLRLATLYMAMENIEDTEKCLDEAERIDPHSSEVHSYRGEMHFAKGQFEEARAEFERAIECEAGNPTPYVNCALALMNTPGPNMGPPDIPLAITMLEKAVEVDPYFHTAYVHLGQMKLSLATDLTSASEVISLYDRGLQYCRTADELKDIVSMRILAVAQVDAAKALKMDTLNMQ